MKSRLQQPVRDITSTLIFQGLRHKQKQSCSPVSSRSLKPLSSVCFLMAKARRGPSATPRKKQGLTPSKSPVPKKTRINKGKRYKLHEPNSPLALGNHRTCAKGSEKKCLTGKMSWLLLNECLNPCIYRVALKHVL